MILNDGNRINSQYCIPQKNRVLATKKNDLEINRGVGGGSGAKMI